MKTLLKLEEAALFGFSIVLFSQAFFKWYWFPALILAPDLAMFGYLVSPKIGAWCYNFAHHRAIAIAVAIAGYFLQSPWLYLCGIILFGHIALDRTLGYGLKYEKGFRFTHLGEIGHDKNQH